MLIQHLACSDDVQRKWAQVPGETSDGRLVAIPRAGARFSGEVTQPAYERTNGLLDRVRECLHAKRMAERERTSERGDG